MNAGIRDKATKAKVFLKAMIQGNGEPILLDQKGIPVHDMGGHLKLAVFGYVSVFPPITLG